jgi:transposase
MKESDHEAFVGLDVSMEETTVCVMEGSGRIVFKGSVSSAAEAVADLLRRRAPHAEGVVLEAGSLSTWHWHGLRALGFPVACVDARHAKAALSMRVNKTGANDAEGLAHPARTGWCREVRVKSMASRHHRSLVAAREHLGKTKRDLENQMRGLMKAFGLLVGKVSGGRHPGALPMTRDKKNRGCESPGQFISGEAAVTNAGFCAPFCLPSYTPLHPCLCRPWR